MQWQIPTAPANQGYYFPLHDGYIELPFPDEIEEEEVDEDEAVEEVS